MNHFGMRLREIREHQVLLLRQLAAKLEIDTALLSKIERGERRANRELVEKVSDVLQVRKEELLVLWFADRIFDVTQGDPLTAEAFKLLAGK